MGYLLGALALIGVLFMGILIGSSNVQVNGQPIQAPQITIGSGAPSAAQSNQPAPTATAVPAATPITANVPVVGAISDKGLFVRHANGDIDMPGGNPADGYEDILTMPPGVTQYCFEGNNASIMRSKSTPPLASGIHKVIDVTPGERLIVVGGRINGGSALRARARC